LKALFLIVWSVVVTLVVVLLDGSALAGATFALGSGGLIWAFVEYRRRARATT
jgi:hypothetical protein